MPFVLHDLSPGFDPDDSYRLLVTSYATGQGVNDGVEKIQHEWFTHSQVTIEEVRDELWRRRPWRANLEVIFQGVDSESHELVEVATTGILHCIFSDKFYTRTVTLTADIMDKTHAKLRQKLKAKSRCSKVTQAKTRFAFLWLCKQNSQAKFWDVVFFVVV